MDVTKAGQPDSVRATNASVTVTVLSDNTGSQMTPRDKRITARDTLTACLRDRNTKGPLRWTKKMSEIAIGDYRRQCRQLGNPQLFHKKDDVVACTALTTNEHEARKSKGGLYFRIPQQKNAKISEDSNSVTPTPKTSAVAKQITLTELDRLLKSTNDEEIYSKYRFRINNSGPSGDPCINISVPDRLPGSQSGLPRLLLARNKNRNMSAPASTRHFIVARLHQPNHCGFSAATRHNNVHSSLLTPQVLSSLEERRQSSAERTRQWVDEIPTVSDESQDASTSEIKAVRVNNGFTMKNKGINHHYTTQSAPAKHSRKRVKFGADSFLYTSPDNAFLFS